MQLIFLVLIICFFVFLYILYYVSHDDFVIVRKDIPLEKIFNAAFLTGFVSLFSARVLFAILNKNPQFFNPLVFFAFPYFPGLSLTGGLVGGLLFIYFYESYKKMPVGKIVDLFVISFIGVLPIGFILTFLLLLSETSFFYNIMFIVSLIIFLLFGKIILPFSLKGEIKDGSLGLIFTAIFSFSYFCVKLFLNIRTFSFVDLENITLLLTLFSSLVILLNREILDKFLTKNE